MHYSGLRGRQTEAGSSRRRSCGNALARASCRASLASRDLHGPLCRYLRAILGEMRRSLRRVDQHRRHGALSVRWPNHLPYAVVDVAPINGTKNAGHPHPPRPVQSGPAKPKRPDWLPYGAALSSTYQGGILICGAVSFAGAAECALAGLGVRMQGAFGRYSPWARFERCRDLTRCLSHHLPFRKPNCRSRGAGCSAILLQSATQSRGASPSTHATAGVI